MPVQAPCSPVRRAIIAVTWPSISVEMRAMSPEAAWMRSVSTVNCADMVVLLTSAAPPWPPPVARLGAARGRPARLSTGSLRDG